MICKRLVYALGIVVAAALPGSAAVTNLQDATYWLEGKSQQLIRQSRTTMSDGTSAFPPQASGGYQAFWLRDYAYMLEGCPEAFTPQEMKNSCLTFVNATRADGAGVDCVGFNGTPYYEPGYGSSTYGVNPVADGYLFTVDVAWRTYQQTKDTALVGQIINKLVTTMNAVPHDPNGNGLVYIKPGTPYDRASWGFTDSVRKTGDELMCSLLDVRANRELADLLDVAGRSSEAATWRATADAKVTSIRSVFWDSTTGLFHAATVADNQPDIMGSAYAVQLGVATSTQSLAIANYFNTNYNAIVSAGQVRHLPGGMYWNDATSSAGTYQNGMFWGVASGWFASTLSLVNPVKSNQMLLDMVNNYQANGVNEYVNSAGTPSGVGNYNASATMPLILLKQLNPSLSQPLLAQVGGTLNSATDVALTSNGGTAFAKNLLSGYTAHSIAHLNDGIYGNSNSWIGSTTATFAGVAFNRPYTISSLAFGRDNNAHDYNGGPYNDRYAGMYVFQYTQTSNPNANTPDAQWTSFGSFALDNNSSTWGDGSATYLRHVYQFDPIAGVTGVRVLLDTANGDNICIDELEVNSVPESGTLPIAAVGIVLIGCYFCCWHRWRRKGNRHSKQDVASLAG